MIDYRVIDAYTANHESPGSLFPASNMLDLLSDFRKIDHESINLLHNIGDEHRSVADYLVNLNKKIDLLAQHLVQESNPLPQSATSSVNLSEDGIAFATDRALYMGNFLALRLMFLPTYNTISLFAKVLRSNPVPETAQPSAQPHFLAARFYRIQDHQRQVLSRHIMQSQILAKQQSKL